MAKVKFNPLMDEMHGKTGNMVLRRSRKGDVYAIKLADMSKVKWSEAQKAHRQRFKEATAYAKAAMADPQVRAQYEEIAIRQNRSPFFVAVSDYLKGGSLLKNG